MGMILGRYLYILLITCSSARNLPNFRTLILPIRLETRRKVRVALVSLAGLAKAARVRHLSMQRGVGRRDPKLSG